MARVDQIKENLDALESDLNEALRKVEEAREDIELIEDREEDMNDALRDYAGWTNEAQDRIRLGAGLSAIHGALELRKQSAEQVVETAQNRLNAGLDLRLRLKDLKALSGFITTNAKEALHEGLKDIEEVEEYKENKEMELKDL